MHQAGAKLKKIAEGREAEMFAWEGGRILRLYRGDFYRGAPQEQARLLRIARECGLRVPLDYGLVEVDGRPGIILERLEGPDLLTELGAKPWRLLQVGSVGAACTRRSTRSTRPSSSSRRAAATAATSSRLTSCLRR
jgi:hypothetical protein